MNFPNVGDCIDDSKGFCNSMGNKKYCVSWNGCVAVVHRFLREITMFEEQDDDTKEP